MHTSKDELVANGIESMTIAHFLTHDTPYPEKTLFIIDESSMIGNQNYLAIQNKVMAQKARAFFVGDITQLQSPTSGIPHELTINTKTQKTVFMEEIMRQNPNPTLKKAVVHASNREIGASLATLSTIDPEEYVKRHDGSVFPNESVIEVKSSNPQEKEIDYYLVYEAIANDYLSRIEEHQKETLVIAHAHEDRREINHLIRRGLQRQGRIGEEEVATTRLASRQLTQAELLSVLNYKVGDVLRFDANYSVAEKGEYFTVEAINKQQKRLQCLSSSGLEFSINPAAIALKSRMSVYQKERASLAEGDTIRLRLTDKNRGHVANKEYTVKGITSHTALLTNEEGSIELNLKEKKDAHWDYAYTTTAFGAQGQTATFVLALELAKRMIATTHRSHEIDVTRARYQATIYTEDKEALLKRLAKLEGDKTSAHQIYEENRVKQEATNKSTNLPPAKAHNMVGQKNKAVSAQDLNLELTHQMESLAHRLLGKPNQGLSSASYLRYGNKGSLSISLNTGLWTNFETNEKGNALQLIGAQMGFSDFKDTLSYAKDFLNHSDREIAHPRPVRKENVESPNKGVYAKKIFDKSFPITGTLAERYLKECRGLQHYKEADLRFIPSIGTWHDNKKAQVPALLSIARDAQGEVNHLQVIRLNPQTGNKDQRSKIIKQTYGAMKGYVVDLNKKSTSDITYLAEGVETGLSIVEIDQRAKVFACLGKENFLKVNPSQLGEHVVLCLDNDGNATFKKDVIFKAIERLSQAGKRVSIILPDKVGADFNDVLRSSGVAGVKDLMDRKIDGLELMQNSERWKQFDGDVNGILSKESNQIGHKKIGTDPELSTINQVQRAAIIQKELVLQR